MTSYDVVVIGAGAAGLSAGALLAKEGKSALVCEKSAYLGGRAARAALTCVEDYLGRRLPGFEETWRS